MRAVIISSLMLAASSFGTAFATTAECPMKIDFKSESDIQPWRAVNDGVMGGRSSGGPGFSDEAMIFKGVINTNGGGFSSLRVGVQQNALADASGIRLRVKSDGRDYKLTLRSDARIRGRSVSFQAPIDVKTANEWEEVVVPFSDLNGSIFGRLVRGAEFNKEFVQEMGIIIADGKDGPFELKVDWLEKYCGE